MTTYQRLFLSLNTAHKVLISNPDVVQSANIYIMLSISKTSSDTVFNKDAFPVCIYPTDKQLFSRIDVGTVALNVILLN